MKIAKIAGLIFLIVLIERIIQVNFIEKQTHLYDKTAIPIFLLVVAGACALAYSLYKDYKNPLNNLKSKAQAMKTKTQTFANGGKYTTIDGVEVDMSSDETYIYRPLGQFMTLEDARKLDALELPSISSSNLILTGGEICCFMDRARTYKSKKITKGYSRNSNSVRVLGTSWRTGVSQTTAIRGNETTYFDGTLYLTNKRIIYVSQGGESFDKAIEKVTSIEEASDGIIVMIGSKTHLIILPTHTLFMQVLGLIKNKNFGMELPEAMTRPDVHFTMDPNLLTLFNKKH